MRYAFCIAALLLSNLLALAETETVTVLVARQRISYGTLLKDPEKYFKAVRYAKGDEPKDAVTSFDQLKGKRVNRPLNEDDPIKTKDLRTPSDKSWEETVIPKGVRACTIKARPNSAASGFVLPLARVDVISTTNKDGKSVSSTILQNVLVVAVESVYDGNGTDPFTVTLALLPKDVGKIRKAEAAGELGLALCSPDEESGKPKKTEEQKLKVPAGMRAVAVKVPPSIANGFVLPNSRVDVISTIRKGDKSVSSTIVRNATVLAVDAKPDGRADDPLIVTVALAPKDIEKVLAAQAAGEIHLPLCPLSRSVTTPRRSPMRRRLSGLRARSKITRTGAGPGCHFGGHAP